MTSICPEFVPNWSVIVLALLLAHALAWLFNIAVAKIGDMSGYTWLLVAIGVCMTLGLAAFVVAWQHILIILVFFVVTGAPMAAGDILRSQQRQRRAQAELLDQARRERDEVLHAG